MSGAVEVGERIAARAAARVRERLRLRIGQVLPEARVVVDGDSVAVSGRGVREALRWLAGMLR